MQYHSLSLQTHALKDYCIWKNQAKTSRRPSLMIAASGTCSSVEENCVCDRATTVPDSSW